MSNEILWKLKHKKTFQFFWSWIARMIFFFGGICFIILGLQKYLNRDDNSLFITIILLVLVLLWFMTSPQLIYKTINLKAMFLTKKSLVLQKYIGSDIILPLGTFYVDISSPSWFAALLVCDDVEIANFNGKTIYTLQLIEGDIENINQLYATLNPFITEFLLSLDKDSYDKAYSILLPITQDFHSNLYKNKNRQFNLDKIDKLREEKANVK